ncbi:MAG: 2OG-Fe(II) oxygenase [Thiovulaceae bacterium]|nr:2OG-Fe(II) oxygenase [Sulfurimonadaceae bacterium]
MGSTKNTHGVRQISDNIFAEDFIFEVDIATPLMPTPYRELPYLVIEDFLDQQSCELIIRATQRDNDAQSAALRSPRKKLDKNIRKTEIYTLLPTHQELYEQAFSRIRPQIEAFFALSLTTSTAVQVLEYTQGSFYRAHADDSSLLVDKNGETVGYKQVIPQRKLSSVLFVSAHSDEVQDRYSYSGGELAFNYFQDLDGKEVALKPKMGTLIVFASNPIYTHEVREVKEGYRLTLVQWHDALL